MDAKNKDNPNQSNYTV